MHRIKTSILLLVIVLTLLIGNVSFASPVNVYYLDNKIEMPVDPIIQNGRTLVPMRATFEAMHFPIEWDNATKTVIARKDSLEVALPINSKYAQFTEWDWDLQDEVTKTVELDVPATVINGHTLVPLRFVSECIGKVVEWDSDTRSVYIKEYPIDYDYSDSGY